MPRISDDYQVTTAKDGTVEFVVSEGLRNFQRTIQVHEREQLDFTGRLVVRLVEHYGVIAGKPDGVDEHGHMKGALIPPEEVVDRAMSIAQMTVSRLRNAGCFYVLPSMEVSEDAAA